MKTFFLHLTFFLSIYIPCSQAQSSADFNALNGNVIDDTGQAVEFASLVLLAADSTFIVGTSTDAAGQFRFNAIDPSAQMLMVSSLEYADTSIHFSEIANQEITIRLQKANYTLSEISVIGKKPLLEQKEDRLIINMSAMHSAKSTSALQLLSRIPGVVVDEQRGSVSLTGKEGVLVMINERLTRVPLNILLEQLRGMQAENIDRIEVIHQPPARYNAEGTGGIINLVMKKDESEGINGKISMMVGYGQREKYGAPMNFNYRSGNISIYGDANFIRSISDKKSVNTFRRFKSGGDVYQHNIDNFFRRQESKTLGGRLGLDYDVTDNTTLGFLFGAGDNAFRVNSDAYSEGKKNEQVTNEFIYNVNTNILNRYYYSNVNLYHKFGENSINVDADYAQYNLSSPGVFSHIGGDASEFPSKFDVDRKNPLRLYTFKADYTRSFSGGHRLELGSKVSMGSIGNDADISSFHDGVWSANDEFSVLEQIHENIYAGYASFVPKISDKISLETGLRYENFNYWVESPSEEIKFRTRNESLFPVLRFNYKLDSINSFQIAFNRRVQRPAFNQLGAQFVFIDPTAVTSGNPRLRPAFTSTLRAAWTHRSVLLSLEATRTKNFISYRQIVNKENNTMRDAPHNFDRFDMASFTLSFPVHLSNWSDINLTAIAQYRKVKDEAEGQLLFSKDKANLIWQYSQSIRFTKTFSADINANRIANALSGNQVRLDIINVNVGFNKRFPDGSSLNLAFMDLLNQRVKITMVYDDPALDIYTSGLLDWSERQVRLTYSVPFGNQKVKKFRQRRTASDEERRRVG